MEQPENFLRTLFDFSFSEFITIKIIKILYGIGIFFAAIAALAFMISGFSASFGRGLLFLIISPVLFLIYTIFARVGLELFLVLFKISDNVGEICRAKNE